MNCAPNWPGALHEPLVLPDAVRPALLLVVDMATLKLKLVAISVALVLAFAAGWGAQGWRMGMQLQEQRTQHARTLQDIAEKTAAALTAVRKYEHLTATHLAETDRQKTEEINAAKSETNRLRRCIAAGTCGVRLISTAGAGAASSRGAADAAAPGMDNEAAAIHGDLQQRVLDLRDAIVEDSAALEYLQEYAKQCLTGAQAMQ